MSTGLLTLRPTSVIPFWSEPILCLAEARAPRQLQPWPPPHGGSVEGEIPPDDAVGFTTRHGPPGNDGKCLELQINDKAARAFAPATHHRSDRIRQGFFNVPSGGVVSANGRLCGLFWTDHCSDGNDLDPCRMLRWCARRQAQMSRNR